MISDRQARKVIEQMQTEHTKANAAAKAGKSERTARKWARLGKLPSEVKIAHTWRTREDSFEGVWDRIRPIFNRKEQKLWIRFKCRTESNLL